MAERAERLLEKKQWNLVTSETEFVRNLYDAKQQFNGVIISCDSRQFYRGLEIGAGRTSQPLVLHLERASHLVPGLNQAGPR